MARDYIQISFQTVHFIRHRNLLILTMDEGCRLARIFQTWVYLSNGICKN